MSMSQRRSRRLFAFDALEGRELMTVAVPAQINMLAQSTVVNTNLVNNLFNSILARSPSDAELTDITNRLGNGALTRNKLALGMLDSVEHRTQMINAAYSSYGETPTPAQLNAGLRYLASKGGNTNQLYANVYGTQAYRNAMGVTTNADFVVSVANNAGITLSQGQINNYAKQLDRHRQSSAKVADLILTSHDAVGVQIDSVYNQYLGYSPNAFQMNQAYRIVASNKRWGLDLALINSAAFVP